MLRLWKPSPQTIGRFLKDQRHRQLSYAEVGGTAGVPPAGYKVDHTRNRIGGRKEAFQAARCALERWQQFELGWLKARPRETPIQAGEAGAVVAHLAGVWMLNACRIVYTIDDTGDRCRFGFAYGTLPDHAATGEERFLVEWDRTTGDVWYDILAFSRPRHPLARLGYPMVRRTQKRFARESTAAMGRAAQTTGHGAPPR